MVDSNLNPNHPCLWQDDMEKAGVVLPLLIFLAIQTEALLYVGGSMDDQMRGRPVPYWL